MVKFFIDVLGFRVSDWLGDFMCFLRCNSAHHRLAILPGPPCLNHVAYDMLGVDDMMRGISRLKQAAPTSAGARAGTPRATTPSAISSRPTASRSNIRPNSRRSISRRTRHKVHVPGPQRDGPVGHRRRRSADDAAPRARSGPVPAGGGLIAWRCSNISRTTSGTCRSRSRWRAAAQIGEIVDMCQPIRDAAASGADAGTPQFMAQWVAMADKLIELADEDEAQGRAFSASDKLERASLYLFTAERMQGHGHPGRAGDLRPRACRRSTARPRWAGSTASGSRFRWRRGTMPALYTRAPGDGPQSGGGLLQRPR